MNQAERATKTILRLNIAEAIKEMKHKGTVGCSFANLKQLTSTKGLMCSVSEFHKEFDGIASEVGASMNFDVYEVYVP